MIEHEQYYRKGGTYELPIEIYNDLIGQIEEAQKERNNYKSRFEKALNEINKIYFTITSNNENYSNLYIKLKDTEQGKNLLNILNGVDEK